MILRRYVSGISVEGLQVSTSGLILTISPGRITVPNGSAELAEEQVFTFPPADVPSDVVIGFDSLGRIYVERNDRGKEPSVTERFGTLTHYIYFTLEPTTESLDEVMVNVLCTDI